MKGIDFCTVGFDDDQPFLEARVVSGREGLDVHDEKTSLVGDPVIFSHLGGQGREGEAELFADVGDGVALVGRKALVSFIAEFAHLDRDVSALTVPKDAQGDDLTRLGRTDLQLQSRSVLDRLGVALDDNVVGLQSGRVGGASWNDLGDQGPCRRGESQSLLVCGADVLYRDTHVAALHLSAPLQGGNDGLDDVGGDGEADPYASLVGGENDRVDSDHLTPEVDKGASGVSSVDGRVGLDVIGVLRCVELTPLGGDDAGGNGELRLQGVANGQDPLSDPNRGGVTQGEEGEALPFDFQEGEIRLGVGPDDLGLVFVPIEGRNRDLLGLLHDMVVRDDVPVGADKEARSEALDRDITLLGDAEKTAPEITEKVVVTEGGAAASALGLHETLGEDLHHSGSDFLGGRREIGRFTGGDAGGVDRESRIGGATGVQNTGEKPGAQGETDQKEEGTEEPTFLVVHDYLQGSSEITNKR